MLYRSSSLLFLLLTITGFIALAPPTSNPLTPPTALAATPAQPPTNPAAAAAFARITVASEGIQRVTGAALVAAGIDLATLNPARVRILHGNQEIAIELKGIGDGDIDPIDEIFFYAPTPGDRWNHTDTYWLMLGDPVGGLRIDSRSAVPSGAASSNTALQRGRWREGQIYDTLMAGALGDHWYAADLRIDPSSLGSEVLLTVPLTPTLPLAAGTSTFTVLGSAYTLGTRTLVARSGTAAQSVSWSGSGAWSQGYTLNDTISSLVLALQRGGVPAGLEIQAVEYVRPIQLNMNGHGAIFEGLNGTWSYAVTGSASGRVLYDVTNESTPVRLVIPNGTSFSFQDGPSRHYVLTGQGSLFEPQITRHIPTNLATPLNASALYIAPKIFHTALAPLLNHRLGQGYSVRVVDVQAIYDAWSGGQVDPQAIRAFLRYARDSWSAKPQGVTLVGDGTADPLNYIKRNNINFIPPYLANVDAFLGETACENCYAQLDGADALSDLLPDVAIGRLPVKSEAELTALVSKILTYENVAIATWTKRAVVITDNGIDESGVPDSAGDFAAQADRGLAYLPKDMDIRRVYYDPSPQRPNEPWREPDGPRAHERTMAEISQGAGLITYVGHSSQFQWAVTNLSSSPSYLLSLYDADALQNIGKTGILREMTCLTAAFHTPAFSGTSIDERLILQPGGAVAIWGSTGKSVSQGHEALLRGFDQALAAAGQNRPTIGSLVLAGYTELVTNGTCCQDSVQTFVLLGDPLTRARIGEGHELFLPRIAR